MEACGTAHHWGRELTAFGHTVSLLPPADVRRYRDGDKTDRAGTKALLEAARNSAIDSVPVKTIDQQAITALHRLRSSYLATRSAEPIRVHRHDIAHQGNHASDHESAERRERVTGRKMAQCGSRGVS